MTQKFDLELFRNDYKNLSELLNKVLVIGEYSEDAELQEYFYQLKLILEQKLDIESQEKSKIFEQKYIDAQNNMEIPF